MTILSDWTTKELFGHTVKIPLLMVTHPDVQPVQAHDHPEHADVCLCVCDPTPEQLAAIQADSRFSIVPEQS